MLDINKVYLGDCLEVMKDIDDNSIDMILCDLPYGVLECSWDSVIPIEKLWEQYERIVKSKAAIVLTATNPFSSMLVISNLKLYRHEWIWKKQNGSNFTSVKISPFRVHEHILVFSKKSCRYTPQFKQGKPYEIKGSKRDAKIDSIKYRSSLINTGGRYPTSILRYNTDPKNLHPTQKPMLLFAYLIQTYTNSGMLVLDNCIGSGTTAIAAMYTDRNFIGIEKEKKYYDISNARIKVWKENH